MKHPRVIDLLRERFPTVTDSTFCNMEWYNSNKWTDNSVCGKTQIETFSEYFKGYTF